VILLNEIPLFSQSKHFSRDTASPSLPPLRFLPGPFLQN
jgi:hypothetical protein